jgi:phosphoserine aminotransferase
MQSLI